MMPAPTKEIAIGMKIRDFEIDSRRMRSRSRASMSPMPVEKSGAMMIHAIVLIRKVRLSGVVKIQP